MSPQVPMWTSSKFSQKKHKPVRQTSNNSNVYSQLAVGGLLWTPEYSDPEEYILKYSIAAVANKCRGQKLN